MATNSTSNIQSYNSFSGVDIKATFGSVVAVPLQAISYAIQREKAPIYTMGYPNPRAYSRGKRGIAGSLVFVMFDKHELVAEGGIFDEAGGDKEYYFWADAEELRPSVATDQSSLDISSIFTQAPAGGAAVTTAPGVELQETRDQVFSRPWYVDQIPAFDIVLTASNEYGSVSVMSIIGVELVNEGYGVSIDDLVSEMQYTFVAKDVVPWHKLHDNEVDGTGPTVFQP